MYRRIRKKISPGIIFIMTFSFFKNRLSVYLLLGILIFSLLLLPGCQNQNVPPSNQKDTSQDFSNKNKNIPSSQGPQGSPRVQEPTMPPFNTADPAANPKPAIEIESKPAIKPAATPQPLTEPEAVTEKEDIQFTLPPQKN